MSRSRALVAKSRSRFWLWSVSAIESKSRIRRRSTGPCDASAELDRHCSAKVCKHATLFSSNFVQASRLKFVRELRHALDCRNQGCMRARLECRFPLCRAKRFLGNARHVALQRVQVRRWLHVCCCHNRCQSSGDCIEQDMFLHATCTDGIFVMAEHSEHLLEI